jgi:hypothetical protein
VRYVRPLSQGDEVAHQTISRTLERAERRLDLAKRDRPRIEEAREALLTRRSELRDEAAQIETTLEALATQDELATTACCSVSAATCKPLTEEEMEIGEPQRIYIVEPLEDPVPREDPAEPLETPSEAPAEPAQAP